MTYTVFFGKIQIAISFWFEVGSDSNIFHYEEGQSLRVVLTTWVWQFQFRNMINHSFIRIFYVHKTFIGCNKWMRKRKHNAKNCNNSILVQVAWKLTDKEGDCNNSILLSNDSSCPITTLAELLCSSWTEAGSLIWLSRR